MAGEGWGWTLRQPDLVEGYLALVLFFAMRGDVPDTVSTGRLALLVSQLAVTMVTLWWAGQRILDGDRRGLRVAVFIFAPGVLVSLLSSPIDSFGVGFGLVGLLALYAIRDELGPADGADARAMPGIRWRR